jgi:predicted AlkP superfamily phosphohydrolase/phosphomutase
MSPPARVVVIGLDSADAGLVSRWCDSGDLPVLRSLRARGAHGRLVSPPGLGDDATWASFSTTVSPARHGRYFWRSLLPGSYRTPPFRDEHLHRDVFWAALGRAGRKVAVIDVPKCPLIRGLNGIQVTDWLVHGRDHRETRSWPEAIAPSLLARFGDDPTDRVDAEWLCRMETLSDREIETFPRRLAESIDRKRQAAAELLDRRDWDLFLVVFKEAHCVGHQCWHLLGDDPLSTEPARRVGNPVRRIYQALDSAIGDLLDAAGPDGHVIVFSDLGMGPNFTGNHLLDAVLLRLEGLLPPLRQRLAFAGHRFASSFRAGSPDGTGDARSRRVRRAFQVEHNEISGAIRLNLVGREPAGRIRPGRAREDFCRFLTRALLDLVNPDTGRPIVDAVLKTDAAFTGDRLDSLPDLLVVWNRDAPITAAASGMIGEIRPALPAYRTGNHVPDGFYVGCGPGVVEGAHVPPASIMDIGPTVAALLETPLADTDGAPIGPLCGDVPVRRGRPGAEGGDDAPER